MIIKRSSNGVFTSLSLGIALAFSFLCTVWSSENVTSRQTLVDTQWEIRKMSSGLSTSHEPKLDLQSAELETDSDNLLKAHSSFNGGVIALRAGDQEQAVAKWNQCVGLLKDSGDQGKIWLRRVYVALALVKIRNFHIKNDILALVTTLQETNAIIRENKLPDMEHIPLYQLGIEHAIQSSLLMFSAIKKLNDVPLDENAQIEILKTTLEKVTTSRLLAQEMTRTLSDSHSVNQETLVDQLLFQNDAAETYSSLFYNLRIAGSELPLTTRAIWTALFATWATEGPSNGLVPIAFGDQPLPPLQEASRFRALVVGEEVLRRFEFPDVVSKLAKGITFLDPSNCPADQTALGIADILIEGGYASNASSYLEISEKGGLINETQCARLKAMVYEEEYRKALSVGELLSSDPITETHYWLGKAYLKLGHAKEALEQFRILFEQAPQTKYAPDACLMAGMISFNSNDLHNANEYFRKAASRYPGSLAGRRARELLDN